jgi:hypothetical protein
MFEQYLHIEAVAAKDLLLGFLAGVALRRGRISSIMDKILPGDDSGQD